MSGHSKWSTIKRKKEKTDGARAKVFTKIGREIAVAVREGGPDPAGNSKLKDVIAKAKANNVPNDNIERIIKEPDRINIFLPWSELPQKLCRTLSPANNNKEEKPSDYVNY